MKRLVITINNLGVGSAGFEYVDLNIWQGKRLLISDKIDGKWSGEFAKVYDIDYDQEHPERLRLESNAPLGVSVLLSIESNECEKELRQQIAEAIKSTIIETRRVPIEQIAIPSNLKPEPTVASLAQEIELLKSTVALQKVQVLGCQNLIESLLYASTRES